eukprot:TRINITY_DN366_c0_g1_i5.p1 TRINITY_DN366_c0_g1~~TRINITY_DN366_c0_g1_i5.p1  ORF type:complete len:356 (-),score=60.11 TRINITY_DN366_c0_g1_i5:113-1180(-)
MRESMKMRREKLQKAKEKMKKKQAENNEKFQQYIDVRGQLRILYKYHYMEVLRLTFDYNTKSIGQYFEFKEYEAPQQIEEYVVIPRKGKEPEEIKYFNADFEILSPEEGRRYTTWWQDELFKNGSVSSSPEDAYEGLCEGIEMGRPNRTTENGDYHAKILTLYDNEKKAFLVFHESKSKPAPVHFSEVSQEIANIAFFLLSLSHITNIPLLYGISIKDDGYNIEGNGCNFPLSLYCRIEESEKKETFAMPPRDAKNAFEHGVCLLNKDLQHIAYVLGCPVPIYQDNVVLPFEWFQKYEAIIVGEPGPMEKIDNSRDVGIYKNIDTFFLRTTRREIQKFVVDEYFSIENFPITEKK